MTLLEALGREEMDRVERETLESFDGSGGSIFGGEAYLEVSRFLSGEQGGDLEAEEMRDRFLDQNEIR